MCHFRLNFASEFWAKHGIISASLQTIISYHIEPKVKCLKHLLWHENCKKRVIRSKWIYINEYDISTSRVFDYKHDALLMLTCTGLLRNSLIFAAPTQVLLFHETAKLYLSLVGLLFFRVICTGRQVSILIDPAAHLIYVVLILVVYYAPWRLLACFSSIYILASYTSPDLLRRSNVYLTGALPLILIFFAFPVRFIILEWIPSFSTTI